MDSGEHRTGAVGGDEARAGHWPVRRLQHIISILRVHVARQCGATDSVEEIRETRVAESGGAVQMERMEHLVSRKARPRVQDKRPHVGRPLSGR